MMESMFWFGSIVTLSVMVNTIVTSAAGSYTAAVVEHEFRFSEVCSAIQDKRERATCMKLENLDVYMEKTEEAAHKGARIIVFPEAGIYGVLPTHEDAGYLAEKFPEPNTGSCACDDASLRRTAHHRLSCMARQYKLYVVANVLDHQQKRAGETGNFYYNTAVAYDPEGLLVAKYHKFHLFGRERESFDRPATSEVSYFDTEFGRVGMFVCFDVLFQEPAYRMVERYNVTEVAFPTAWFDELPLWSAVGVHSAWAVRMGVNFLSANIRFPSLNMLGSGIYTSDGPLAWTRDTHGTGSTLLVAQVPQHHTHPNTLYYRPHETPFSSPRTFQSKIFHDLYTFTALESGSHRSEVCMGTLCCRLKYTSSIAEGERYVLGVFNGLHTAAQQYLHMQNCVLTKCAGQEDSSCGQKVSRSETKFDHIRLEGTFEAEYIFPQVVTDNVQLVDQGVDVQLGRKASVTLRDGLQQSVLLVALSGRIYDVEPAADH